MEGICYICDKVLRNCFLKEKTQIINIGNLTVKTCSTCSKELIKTKSIIDLVSIELKENIENHLNEKYIKKLEKELEELKNLKK